MLIEPITVASVPSAHPYVQHLSDPGRATSVVRLPDPAPSVTAPAPGQWWPPRILEVGWIEAHHHEIDLVHVHFGFESAVDGQLEEWVAQLAVHHIPLVVTVHDLDNPHLSDQERHHRQLGVLVPAATELITLTTGTAAVIRSRWGRTATVIPHPHVVPLDRIAGPRPTRHPVVVGIHAKSLRANIDPVPLLVALADALATMPNVQLRLDAHHDVLDRAADDPRAADLLRWMVANRGHPQVRIEVHGRMDDDQLWDYLESIDLCVLPYRFGTHSGWLEACVDLGTAAVVPAIGCYHDQHGHPAYRDGRELVDLVQAFVTDPDPARPGRPDRRRQRALIASAHEQVYRRALAADQPTVARRVRAVSP